MGRWERIGEVRVGEDWQVWKERRAKERTGR